jgi:hypothetical protein
VDPDFSRDVVCGALAGFGYKKRKGYFFLKALRTAATSVITMRMVTICPAFVLRPDKVKKSFGDFVHFFCYFFGV